MISIDSSWTLFLDRDGVINQRNFDGYITSVDDFYFTNGTLRALEKFNSVFSTIVVVTNQQGIGKKIMSTRNLEEIHGYMQQEVEANGGRINKIYYSPDLKSQIPNTRKPNAAMAEMAKGDFPSIDFSKSIMVGDTDSDLKFGMNIGMTTVAIKSKEVLTVEADYTFDSLLDFASHIKLEK